MEEVGWSKMDVSLRQLYRAWLLLKEHGWDSGYPVPKPIEGENESLLVTLVFTDELADFTDLGFRLHLLDEAGVAFGHILLSQLPAITQRPNCSLVKFGPFPRLNLADSAPSIRARDMNDGLSEGLWHFSDDPPVFDGNNGEDVVIGIIDSGIDYKHEFFRTADGTGSRILAIWDMGLTAVAGESLPDASLVRSGTAYGVEYTQSQIEAAINGDAGAIPIRHFDPDGHGTHVAGIAAGNGRPEFTQIGVAPEAKIIVVNYVPSVGVATVGGSPVDLDVLFRDALHYVRRKARGIDKATPDPTVPVVLNCSFGTGFGPHDGRAYMGPPSQESYLRDFRLDTSGNEIPGSVVVFASGNYAGRNRHLKIQLDGNPLPIPFTIVDDRATPNSEALRIELWYIPDPNVTIEVQVPDGNTSGATALNTQNSILFDAANDKQLSVDHFNYTDNTQAYGQVSRNGVIINLAPANNNFLTGQGYSIIINGPAGTELRLWTEPENGTVFPTFDRSGIEASVQFENQETCGSPSHSPDVITVANYNHENDRLALSSSRGPLVNYLAPNAFPVPAGPNDLQFDFNKPNIAAPGTDISSAGYGTVKRCKCCRKVDVAVNYTSKTGTSMACPHVSGVIALMLNKNKGLKQSEIMQHIQNNRDTGIIRYLPDGTEANWNTINDTSPAATANEIGAGKVDAKSAVGAVADPATP
ncbi:MAG: S8 family serine peptidase [Bacteroidota bacterium]